MAEDATFGDLLRRYRRESCLTQEQLAERAGLSPDAVSTLERGARQVPHKETVDLLARALRLGPSDRARLAATVRYRRRTGSGNRDGSRLATLPLPLTSFVGRERQLADVAGELESARLVTLTGAGGIGKTRLGLEVARAVAGQFPDGVRLAELASLADAALLPQVVASALGIREAPGRPLLATLLAALGDRRLLLLLDNCEHLVVACASLTEALLQGCPGLRVLATSRTPLGVPGEVTCRVPPLSAPSLPGALSPREARDYAAVRLFAERAALARPGFALTARTIPAVARLCARLDGIPLAIELAAARVGGLGVEELALRLEEGMGLLASGSRTALPRQQSMRATLDWSYHLLDAPDQRLFERLAVFTGWWTLEAAEAVGADAALPREAVTEGLLRLVDQSVATAAEQSDGGVRYRLLEPLRQLAQEHLLSNGGAEAVRRRHAAYYLALAEAAEPALRGPEQPAWLARLDAEHANLRTALAWALGRQDGEAALRLVAALGYFWWLRGHWQEWDRWLERALAIPPPADEGGGCSAGYRLARARALLGRALRAYQVVDTERAADLAGEALPLCRASGDTWGEAAALVTLAGATARRGERERGYAAGEEGLVLARRLGDPWLLSWLLLNVASPRSRWDAEVSEGLALARRAGDPWLIGQALVFSGPPAARRGDRSATALISEGLAALRIVGDRQGVAVALLYLGRLAAAGADYAAARAMNEERLALEQALGNSHGIAHTLETLGAMAWAEGELARAATHLEEALSLRMEQDEPTAPVSALIWLGRVARTADDLPGAAARLEEALATSRASRYSWGVAATLTELGRVVLARDEVARADALLRESLALWRDLDVADPCFDPFTDVDVWPAVCFEGLAGVAIVGDDGRRAARLLGAAESMRAAARVVVPPPHRADRVRMARAAREEIGAAAFAATYAEGRALTPEQAIADALRHIP